MAQEQETNPADSGTTSTADNTNNTPEWDKYNGEMHPFLNINEDIKRAGFRVKFLSDSPRKETVNNFDNTQTDFWFDVESDGETYTWTFSQKSLVMELQKHKPLSGKTFEVKLIPVDDEFKKQFPKYKGKDRYTVALIDKDGQIVVEEETVKD